MSKTNNIVHQYFKKEFPGFKLLVKVNPIQFKGTELIIPDTGAFEIREMDFDHSIFDDLKQDDFTETTALEFNLYIAGLVSPK